MEHIIIKLVGNQKEIVVRSHDERQCKMQFDRIWSSKFKQRDT